MMEIPLFVICGFLDSGKSSFIVDAIQKDGFDKKGRTLVVLCEEGEIELTEAELSKHNCSVVVVENEEDLTAEYMSELATKYIPDRVLIEMNGMWNLNEIYFPEIYRVAQVITFIDFTTFEVYYNNMKQKVRDMLLLSDLVVFNRCYDLEKLATYQTSLKLTNGNASYMVMDDDGVVKQAFEDPLPYDINADIIEISDDDFGRWYIDTFENPDRYKGKKVKFNGVVTLSKKLPKDTFLLGRYAMTCCADDVQLYAHLCKNIVNAKIKNKMWVNIVARIEFEYSEEYQEEEAVLYPEKITAIKPLKNAILDLR